MSQQSDKSDVVKIEIEVDPVVIEADVQIKLEHCDEDERTSELETNPYEFSEVPPMPGQKPGMQCNVTDGSNINKKNSPTVRDKKRNRAPNKTKRKDKRKQGTSKLTCDTCKKDFKMKHTLIRHILCSHRKSNEIYSCEICKEQFNKKTQLTQHKRTHKDVKPFTCKVCDKQFAFKYILSKHELIHSEKQFSCSVCNKEFTYKSHLTEHQRIHTGVRPYKCPICNKHFPYKSNLNRHVRCHSGEKPFMCSICNKQFAYKFVLTEHERLHSDVKPFVCVVCNKQFAHQSNLTKHERIHSGYKPFGCSICNKTFAHKYHLAEHERIHSADKPHVCNICNKQFSHKSNLTKHVHIHTGIKPFLCTICNKYFSHKTNLTKHVHLHTGEKPFACNICNKQFAFKYTLTEHQHIHSEIKPFLCSICNKQFANRSNLTKHERSHSGDKPFTCSVCSKQFYQKSHLMQHERIHQSVEMCTPEAWRGGGVARSPSHESVTTDLSLFSVSSAASDARVLRLLACKAGQGPDPALRVASPNPDSKLLKRPSSTLPLAASDACRELLAGCAALCAQLGLRRSFSAGDVAHSHHAHPLRSATSEVGLCAALEQLALSAASRSCSTWVAGGSQLPSPQRAHPAPPAPRPLPSDNKKVRQSYIKRRLLTTYRALERMSQSEFNLDRLEAVAVCAAASAAAGPGPSTLAVPAPAPRQLAAPPAREAAHLALTAADLERERGRPLSKYERNMMIFNWLHTLDEAAPF